MRYERHLWTSRRIGCPDHQKLEQVTDTNVRTSVRMAFALTQAYFSMQAGFETEIAWVKKELWC